MSRKMTRLTAFLTALTCITALASCGNDVVPQAENSGASGGFSITSDTVEGNDDNQTDESSEADENTDSSESTTTAGSTDTEETTTATTTANYSFETRDPAVLATTKKPVVTNAPATPNGSATRTTVAVPNAPVNNSTSSIITGNAPTVTTTATSVTTSSLSGITLSYYSANITVGQTLQYPVVSEVIREIWTSSNESIATVDGDGNITGVGEGECIIRVVSDDNSDMGAEVKVTVKKASEIKEIDGITYVNDILIANKTYELPATYNPGGLTYDTSSAFEQLSADAANAGLNIYLSSGFRSYEYQDEIYNNYVWAYGQATADTFSARPGHSEHQTGLAIDVNSIDDSFAGTPEAIWLEEHCYEYGFIIRYPKGKSDITGYKYEPWHIRYVGKDVAQELHDAAVACGDPTLTLEEYLGITSVYQ
ncbi:MAG: D-alanyl-D-alanine carboxypeptidase family protein [Ruminococcus flavefaciens]|nr:D-alanyl-D-alanine carboxypeptidase family protein [Ruminococcus flavefaciens]MCM1230532.1 D-alanyl-D-alanine carboxypeptidase family protein [Ruminococcus flavefaciens]